LDPAERDHIRRAGKPGEAKRRGRRATIRPDWEEVKLDVMEDLLRQKFVGLARALVMTGDEELVEGNTWGDRFWGVCQGAGENHLGRLLMKIRSELKGQDICYGLTAFAHMELEAAGLFAKDSDYDGALGQAVVDLVELFASQGHSGASAARVLALFGRVAAFRPLTPLTGNDDEWNEVSADLWQNKRRASVFKGASGAYDIDAVAFRDPNGWIYTNGTHTPVTFPYTPPLQPQVVDAPPDKDD
jgi:hypothetical protein